MWANYGLPWVEWHAQPLLRVGAMAGLIAASAVLYFGALWAAGLKLRQFVRH
jgi:putative peptidoglycan lipid II flippase